MIKEYLEIKVILEYEKTGKKESFILIKSFNVLKISGLTKEIWQVKNYNIYIIYEFRFNVLVESPRKQLRNRIPLPSGDVGKKRSIKHDSHILDFDLKKLKKISDVRKLSEQV